MLFRSELLAKAANSFLDNLLNGKLPDVPMQESLTARPVVVIAEEEEEERVLGEINEWVVSQGLPPGELDYEVVDSESGDVLGVLDLAWPEGLQPGLSQPTALLLGEGEDTEEAANQGGFRFYTTPKAFRKHVEKHVLGLQAEGA